MHKYYSAVGTSEDYMREIEGGKRAAACLHSQKPDLFGKERKRQIVLANSRPL